MRYSDAPHMNFTPFLNRKPVLGRCFAGLGAFHLIILVVSILPPYLPGIYFNFVSAFCFWLLAWYLAVGIQWRTHLEYVLLFSLLALIVIRFLSPL